MKLTEKEIERFQKIYQNIFNEKISPDDALEKGIAIINLLRIALKN